MEKIKMNYLEIGLAVIGTFTVLKFLRGRIVAWLHREFRRNFDKLMIPNRDYTSRLGAQIATLEYEVKILKAQSK